MAKVIAVCKSEKKGTKKGSIVEGILKEDLCSAGRDSGSRNRR